MPRIVEETNAESPIARFIFPKSGQIVIICKNYIYKAAVNETLDDQSRSRSHSGDSLERDYVLNETLPTRDSPAVTLRTLNIVATGDIKKVINVLINAQLISISTFRQASDQITLMNLYEPEEQEEQRELSLTPTP